MSTNAQPAPIEWSCASMQVYHYTRVSGYGGILPHGLNIGHALASLVSHSWVCEFFPQKKKRGNCKKNSLQMSAGPTRGGEAMELKPEIKKELKRYVLKLTLHIQGTLMKIQAAFDQRSRIQKDVSIKIANTLCNKQ